jgi:hypothetical protein
MKLLRLLTKYNAVFTGLAGLGLGLALAFLLVGLPRLAGAQGPAGDSFTYQGRLLRSGSYINGVCDFQFGLYDAPTGGTRSGSTQVVSGVAVSDGYFAVELNDANQFGSGAFTGDQRYLQIAARCGTDLTYTTMTGRVALNVAPYALYARNASTITDLPWTNVISKPAGFADDVDNVVTYTNGFGLALSGTQFSVVTNAVLSAVGGTWQRRVTGSCTGAEAIQAVYSDGTVLCGTTSPTYTAGTGLRDLSLTGNAFVISDAVVQRLITDTRCTSPTGQAIRRINQNGAVQCETIPQGTITEVNAGAGLTATNPGGPVVSLRVADGGILGGMLADGAVTSAKIADGAVGTDQLADGAVTTANILNRSLRFEDFGMTPCADGQVMKRNGSTSAPYWECATDEANNITAGPGIAMTGSIVAVKVGEGITVANNRLSAWFGTVSPGNSGTANTAARSDHNHDSLYVGRDTPAPSLSPAATDLSGSYNLGFTVAGLRGVHVSDAAPTLSQTLRYYSGQWQPAAYDFPFNLGSEVVVPARVGAENNDGEVSASCPDTTNQVVIGGGCECQGNDNLEDSYPTYSAWHCNCDNGSGNTNYAHVICLNKNWP